MRNAGVDLGDRTEGKDVGNFKIKACAEDGGRPPAGPVRFGAVMPARKGRMTREVGIFNEALDRAEAVGAGDRRGLKARMQARVEGFRV